MRVGGGGARTRCGCADAVRGLLTGRNNGVRGREGQLASVGSGSGRIEASTHLRGREIRIGRRDVREEGHTCTLGRLPRAREDPASDFAGHIEEDLEKPISTQCNALYIPRECQQADVK